MKTCKDCGYEFSHVSQRYYCCNESEQVCIVCRRNPCKICKKPRTLEVFMPKCERCYTRANQNDLLFEYSCQRYYCAKCLAKTFKEAYDKVAVSNMYDEKNGDLYVRMYCGHEYPYYDLVRFFQHFCLQCGRNYDDSTDHELIDGIKLCSVCFRYFGTNYKNLFIRCLSCDQSLQNSSKAQIVDEGTVLCNMCFKQSQLQQRIISESRKVEQSFQNMSIKSKQNQSMVNNSNNSLKNPSKIQNQQQIPNIVQTQQKKSPLSKLFKKPSIKQLKQKGQQRQSSSNSSNSHGFSVTSKFSNNGQEIDEQLTKELGLAENIKMKKHLSNDTFVEQLKVEIQKNEGGFVTCKNCNVMVESKVAFDLFNLKLKDLEIGQLVEFGKIEARSKEKNAIESPICRVCYYVSAQREKSLLDLSKSRMTSTRSTNESRPRSNRPSKLQQDSSTMSYLKVQNSSRRQNRSPSPSPKSQYDLTGNKDRSKSKDSKNFVEKLLQKTRKTQEPQKLAQSSKSSQNPSLNSKHFVQSGSNRLLKCQMCRDFKKTLILTSNQSHLCDDCYYKKNSFGNYFRR